MANIGYARVLSREQHLGMQLTALRAKGCQTIFKEKVSGFSQHPEFEKYLSFLREGNTLVVYKFDRLGRSLKNLLEIFDSLNNRGIELISIQDGIDGSSNTGKLMMSLMAALAEFEWSVIVERCSAGRKEAQQKGKKLGRPKGIPTKKIDACAVLYNPGESIEDIQAGLTLPSNRSQQFTDGYD